MKVKYTLVPHQDSKGAIYQFYSNSHLFCAFPFRMLCCLHSFLGVTGTSSSQNHWFLETKQKTLLKNLHEPRMIGKREICLPQGLWERFCKFWEFRPFSQISPRPRGGHRFGGALCPHIWYGAKNGFYGLGMGGLDLLGGVGMLIAKRVPAASAWSSVVVEKA